MLKIKTISIPISNSMCPWNHCHPPNVIIFHMTRVKRIGYLNKIKKSVLILKNPKIWVHFGRNDSLKTYERERENMAQLINSCLLQRVSKLLEVATGLVHNAVFVCLFVEILSNLEIQKDHFSFNMLQCSMSWIFW